MRQLAKWGCLGALGLVALVVVIGVIAVATAPPVKQGDLPKPPQQEKQAPKEKQKQEATPSNKQAIRVEVQADRPVDVSIISSEDISVMISEQTQSESFEFDLRKGADLLAEAADPNLNSGGLISVKVFVDGKLEAEDTDKSYAQVTF